MGFQGGAGTSCRYHTGGRLGGEPGPPKHRRAAEGCPRAKGVMRADAGWAPRATWPPPKVSALCRWLPCRVCAGMTGVGARAVLARAGTQG